MKRPFILSILDGRAVIFLVVILGIAVLVPVLNLLVPASSPFHVPNHVVPLLGKYLCYALLAVKSPSEIASGPSRAWRLPERTPSMSIML
jgi:hypothetical protein